MNKPDSVLLVDDDEVCNFLNSNVIHLADGSLKVHTATNGHRALDFVKKQKKNSTQLILLDLSMPEMDGFEFLEEYVKLPEEKRKNKVIVILTSSDYEEDRQRAKKYHVVCGYITKPLTHEKLVTVIETCFRDPDE